MEGEKKRKDLWLLVNLSIRAFVLISYICSLGSTMSRLDSAPNEINSALHTQYVQLKMKRCFLLGERERIKENVFFQAAKHISLADGSCFTHRRE